MHVYPCLLCVWLFIAMPFVLLSKTITLWEEDNKMSNSNKHSNQFLLANSEIGGSFLNLFNIKFDD